MKINKYSEFITEAKKDDAKQEIIQMLKKMPTITMSDNHWPTEKGIYSQAGMIKYLKGKYTNHQVLGGLTDIINDKKSDLKHIMVKNCYYSKSYPYYYIGMTEDEAKKLKFEYEEKNELDNKKEMDAKKVSKEKAGKKVEDRKSNAKKATKVAPKKRELKSSKK